MPQVIDSFYIIQISISKSLLLQSANYLTYIPGALPQAGNKFPLQGKICFLFQRGGYIIQISISKSLLLQSANYLTYIPGALPQAGNKFPLQGKICFLFQRGGRNAFRPYKKLILNKIYT